MNISSYKLPVRLPGVVKHSLLYSGLSLALAQDKIRLKMALDVDKVLQHIGQFGPYQIRILGLFLFTIFPITYQTLIMVFIAFEPPWMCVEGSSSCQGANFTNGSSVQVFSTATKPKSLYERRCSLNRTEWKFADYDLYDGPHLTIVNQVNSEFIGFSLIILPVFYTGCLLSEILLPTPPQLF